MDSLFYVPFLTCSKICFLYRSKRVDPDNHYSLHFAPHTDWTGNGEQPNQSMHLLRTGSSGLCSLISAGVRLGHNIDPVIKSGSLSCFCILKLTQKHAGSYFESPQFSTYCGVSPFIACSIDMASPSAQAFTKSISPNWVRSVLILCLYAGRSIDGSGAPRAARIA